MRVGPGLVVCALVLSVAEAAAQPAIPQPAPDFFIGEPHFSVGVRGGWTFARGGSDWYDFVTDTLTLEDRDFDRPTVAFDFGVAATQQLEVVASLDFGRSTTLSEYRHFVDNFRLPIEQVTELRQTNLSGGVKFYLVDRGRPVGRLAWVPRSVVPFVGGGAGVLWYHMKQHGDFVDYVDYSVFPDLFESSGAAPSGHVFGGVDWRMWRRLYATFEVRHLWAAGDLGPQWIDFDSIDLAGTRVSAGINVAF